MDRPEIDQPEIDRPHGTLLISCGALAREIVALTRANGWDEMAITCLPAHLHNDPDRIPEGVRERIREGRKRYERIYVLFADCGTGGELDRVLEEEGVERIVGNHCYEVFTGAAGFEELMESEPASFFLTDFLVRHFDRLILEGMGINRHPKLMNIFFGKYKRLVYLAQIPEPQLVAKAETAAETLGLEFEMRVTGLGNYESFLAERSR